MFSKTISVHNTEKTYSFFLNLHYDNIFITSE